jgi:hypothetical protein
MRIAILLAVLSLGACAAPLPEGGVEIPGNDPAVQAALSFAGASEPTRHPPVYWVLPEHLNCGDEPGYHAGFINPETGNCVGGLTVDGAGVWIALQGRVSLHSQLASLCHEMRHVVHGDHGHSEAVFGKRVGPAAWERDRECQAFLAGMPDIDRVDRGESAQ